MAAKKKVSIETAKAQLEQAIQADKSRLLDELTAIRNELEDLVDLVGSKALGPEVNREIEMLTRLFDVQKTQKKKRGHIKTTDKKEFVVKTLEEFKGEIPKAKLLKLAGIEFGIEPAITFLDTALKDKRFKTDKKGSNRAFVSLVRQS